MDFLLIGLVFLLVGGMIFKWTILLAFVLLLSGYFLLHSFYDRQLDKKLSMNNERKTIRLFPQDETELPFIFANNAVFPYLNGVFRFQSGSSITSVDYLHSKGRYIHTYEIPLTIAAKGRTKLQVPVQAQKRGVVTLRNISFTFAHLTSFHSAELTYDAFYPLEILIYPEPRQVAGIEKLVKMNEGTAVTNMAMFENIQNRIGVRDYQPGDPFYRINWKATAKTQELQTNVFEKVVDRSYVFMINIAPEPSSIYGSTSSRLEDLLAYTAYLCQYAYKNNLPFSMYINARTFSETDRNGCVKLLEGEDRVHYMQALDMLARIHTQGMVLPFEQMLMSNSSQSGRSKTIVIVGHTDNQSSDILTAWACQTGIYQVNVRDGTPVLERFLVKEAVTNG
ncbi:DUF58 domain-containing protein [Virgibacillus halophilus]